MSSAIYECVRCGRKTSYEELTNKVALTCPVCGYAVFRKVRAPIVKRLKCR